MKFVYDGSFKVNRPADETYRFLISPEQFAPLLPYFKGLRDVTADGFMLVMEIGIPQMRGQAEVKVNRLPTEEGLLEALYKASGKHSLGMVDSRLSYGVSPTGDAQSEVAWKCESLVSGTLASLAQGILAPLARRNIDQMVKSVQRALNGDSEPEEEKSGILGRMSGGVRRFMTKGERA